MIRNSDWVLSINRFACLLRPSANLRRHNTKRYRQIIRESCLLEVVKRVFCDGLRNLNDL